MILATRFAGRAASCALLFGGFLAVSAASAEICGDVHVVEAGDTLSAIATRCGTTVSALVAANPVDPRRMAVGTRLAMPRQGAIAGTPVARESSRRSTPTAAELDPNAYVVRAGDTLKRVARRLQIDVRDLLSANPGLEGRRLRRGEQITVPTAEDRARFAEKRTEREAQLAALAQDYPDATLKAESGDWRQTIDLSAEGLAPGEELRVAVSGGDNRWTILGDVRADADGTLKIRARVPGKLAGAPALQIAAERPWGDHLTAMWYRDRVADLRAERRRSNHRLVTVAGKVIRVVDCNLLMTRDGRRYALRAGDGVRPGNIVVVSGSLAPAGGDACFGSRETLTVSSIRAY